MGLQGLSEEEKSDEDVPFFPNVLLAEMSLAFAAIGLLITFVSLFPLGLGVRFDPTHPPVILEPEWYFMGVYQILKTQGVHPVYAIVLLTGLALLMLAVPFIDRGSERHPLKRPFFVAFAFIVADEFLGLTIFGYLSPGQVGSFSEPRFTVAFLTTNAIAVILASFVFYVTHRMRRNVKR